uniref:AAA-ATPase n=1 Tax=Vitis vinifera TaxID=29760 RepID=A5C6P0_VITVI|nr:hypothetical protein VITISV_023956 [Vitis vinifera]
MKEFWSSLASLLGVLAFCQSILHAVFPPELRFAVLKLFKRLFNCSSYCYFDITEIDGVNTNELYNAVQLYLSSSASITGSRLSLTRALNSSSTTFGLSNNDSLVDTFNGVSVLWEHVVTQRQSQTFSWRPLPEEKRGFTLRIKKGDKHLILNSYLDYITEKANDIRRKNQERFLYTNSRGGSLDFQGPPVGVGAVQASEHVRHLGYGSHHKKGDHGRSQRLFKRPDILPEDRPRLEESMIAAMANFLGYDVYDLELTEVHTNSELRKLLMKTSSKSIIVIEDIDCSINLGNRKKSNSGGRQGYDGTPHEMRGGGGAGAGEDGVNSITLSGLLNFTDGLWSCCGSERIFVFTTNHIEKLDPALLRSGRMDMHIFMSYCTFPALKILLQNYLGFSEPDMGLQIMEEIEAVIDKAQMTPADISEVLIKNRRHKDKALSELLEALRNMAERRKKENWRSAREKNSTEVEEEEQEKRALENPKQGCDEEFEESCKKEEEDDEEKLN